MTTDEEKLVMDNLNLAYNLAWKSNAQLKGYIDIEDLQGICLLGLTKAAKTYKSDLGFTFSTYAYKVMDNEIKMELRKKNKLTTISINTPTSENLTLEDTIASDYDIFEVVADSKNLDILREEIKNLSPKHQKILNLLMQGLTQEQIAKKLGTTQPTIARTYYRIINKLRKKFDV